MEITEVRIKLMEGSEDRLRAFCSITFDDCFVVRDLKIIEGNNGPFVAMPSRKLSSHCRECNSKNHLRSRYCNQCGKRQPQDKIGFDVHGRAKLYADIAHPINARCREMIQEKVIGEFYNEMERAQQPGYVSKYDDDYDLDEGGWFETHQPTRPGEAQSTQERADQSQNLKGPHKNQTESSDSNVGSSEPDEENEFGRGIF